MIFHPEYNIPKYNGATDYRDSPVLAGLLKVVKHPQADKIFLPHYIDDSENFVRCPGDDPKDFSRDQLIPLAAAFALVGWTPASVLEAILVKGRAPNGDFISPSQRGHLKACYFEKRSWFEKLWLKLDIYYSAYVDPLAEPNQLICMLVVAGPEYVNLWITQNEYWEQAIWKYWASGDGAWRGEPDFALELIHALKNISDRYQGRS